MVELLPGSALVVKLTLAFDICFLGKTIVILFHPIGNKSYSNLSELAYHASVMSLMMLLSEGGLLILARYLL